MALASPLSSPSIQSAAEPQEFLWKGPRAGKVLWSWAEVLGFSAQLSKHRALQLKAVEKKKITKLSMDREYKKRETVFYF